MKEMKECPLCNKPLFKKNYKYYCKECSEIYNVEEEYNDRKDAVVDNFLLKDEIKYLIEDRKTLRDKMIEIQRKLDDFIPTKKTDKALKELQELESLLEEIKAKTLGELLNNYDLMTGENNG